MTSRDNWCNTNNSPDEQNKIIPKAGDIFRPSDNPVGHDCSSIQYSKEGM